MGDFTLSLFFILYFHFFYFPYATYQRLRVPTIRNRTCRRFRTLIQDNRRDRSKKQPYRRDQICQVIGITAHSRLGCKGDASPRRHRSKFISLNLSFYIILSKIPIKTSIKYLATLDNLLSQLCSHPVTKTLSFLFHLSLLNITQISSYHSPEKAPFSESSQIK